MEDKVYSEMYVKDMLNAETCVEEGGEERLLTATFSAISGHNQDARECGTESRPSFVSSGRSPVSWLVS